MEKNFWLERWARHEIGFHQAEINSRLKEHWRALHPAPGSRVFVPLCGKSRDMLWLREQGHDVVGVELCPIAVREFFGENALVPHHPSHRRFAVSETNGIRILCGDFFDLDENDLAGIAAVYDRASLIALPPDMRVRYARHLLNILPPDARVLLLALDYPQKEMQGPPFSVPADEVTALYGGHAGIRLLAQSDVLERDPGFRARGVSRMNENVFAMALHA